MIMANSIQYRYLMSLIPFLHFLAIIQINLYLANAKVHVKIYDHRAYHDPVHWYGRGPWKYFGHGYGVDYGYDHDGNQSHERAFAREFCKEGKGCRPPDPNFWKTSGLSVNGLSAEPYFGRPPADVMEPTIPQTVPQFVVKDTNYFNRI